MVIDMVENILITAIVVAYISYMSWHLVRDMMQGSTNRRIPPIVYICIVCHLVGVALMAVGVYLAWTL